MPTPTTNPGSQATICLVILGRSPHENVLRRSPEIDVIRARQTCDALGELGYATEQHSESRIVLLLGDQTPDGHSLEEFLSASRLIVPDLRVIGDTGGSYPETLCRELLPSDGHAAVRFVLSQSRKESGVGAPEPERAQMAPQPSEPRATGMPVGDSHDVVESLLRGRSILEPALSTLGEMLEGAHVRFVSASERESLGDAPRVEVSRGEAVFGWLVGLSPDDARSHDAARWLAS
ncbi:MAG: hypothetical protein ACYTF7_05305, partial [Planctomycetota bacterium]